MGVVFASCVLLLLYLVNNVGDVGGYVVGTGLNVRFAQILHTDPKFQELRETMIRVNTENLVKTCRIGKLECNIALAKMRYKASRHFYVLAKAVVDYVRNRRIAQPTGYAGTAVFCNDENICVPESDPPVLPGGCYTLISCGLNNTWNLDLVEIHYNRSRRYDKYK